MKKSFVCVMIVLLATIIGFGAGQARAASDKPIDLKFSLFLPPTHRIIQNVYNPWIKKIEERTNGKVKITIYPGSTLGAAKDQYDLVLRGIADMTTHILAYTPGRFPLTDVMNLPLNVPSAKVGARTTWELYEKYFNREFQNVKVLMLSAHEPGQLLISSKKPAATLEDMKGMKIKASWASQIAMLKALGGTALTLSVPETYDAMQKGMADGAWVGLSSLVDFKMIDVTKSQTILNSTCALSAMVMNMETWKKLPPDVQKVFNELSGESLSVAQAAEFDNTAKEALEMAKAKGQKIYELAPADRKAYDEKAQPVCDAWVAEMEKKGLPGKAVYQEAVNLLAKYSK
jgi:TRAP-type transport system periplasmic protein